MRFLPAPKESNYLNQLEKNATIYFRKKFPNTICVYGTQWGTYSSGQRIYFKTQYHQDEEVGVKYRVIAIDNLGKSELAIETISLYKFESSDQINSGYTGKNVPTTGMTISPRVFIYTNKLYGDVEKIQKYFNMYQNGVYIQVIDESELHKTLFISYGTPDEEIASKINKALKAKGVNTWFFPEDSIPGDKLHRMMNDAVYNHDRTLLVCSKASVSRSGVLNEIERLLEREANEGGADIIIPVALDDYIFADWTPEMADIKRQVTSRVVSKMNESNFHSVIDKILKALKL